MVLSGNWKGLEGDEGRREWLFEGQNVDEIDEVLSTPVDRHSTEIHRRPCTLYTRVLYRVAMNMDDLSIQMSSN